MVNTLSAVPVAYHSFSFLDHQHVGAENRGSWQRPDKAERAIILGSALTAPLLILSANHFGLARLKERYMPCPASYSRGILAMLKWDETPDPSHALRWLILIAYLIGLSIGVHLMNLLAIPAISFIYYFKKYQTSLKGIVITLGASFLLLALTLYGIIPWIVKLAGYSELSL